MAAIARFYNKFLSFIELDPTRPAGRPDPRATLSHPPGGRLPLLSARPAVTFPAKERHRQSARTKLYCLVTEAHAREQLAQGCYLEADRPRFEPATFWIASERSTVKPHRPQAISTVARYVENRG